MEKLERIMQNTWMYGRMRLFSLVLFLLCFHLETVQAESFSVYKKITDMSELVVGDEYIIVRENSEQAYAMGKIGVNHAGAGAKVAVNLQGNIIVNPSSDVMVFKLGGKVDEWTLKCSSGYLSAKNNETNMEYKSSVGSYSKWIITLSYIKCSNQFRYLRFSNIYGFKCYTGYVGDPNLEYEEVSLFRLVKGIDLQVGSLNYATMYYGDVALVVPANVKAHTYKINDGKLVVSKTYQSGQTIPAGTAVVIAALPGSYSFLFSSETGEVDTSNLLRGSDVATTTTPPYGDISDYYYYMLSLNANSDIGSAGFYFGEEDGVPFINSAHKAYLVLPKSEVSAAKSFLMTDLVTSIKSLTMQKEQQHLFIHYNLAGQPISSSYRGISIVQGKKIVTP